MAESDTIQSTEMTQEEMDRLKYLEFIQIATLHAVVFLSKVYDYAKENSGPLKPGVQTVEGTVKTVVGPVCEKYHDVPFELLKLADRKVDGLVHKVDQRVPPLVKEASNQALSAAQKVPGVARGVASEFQRAGMVETAAGMAKTAYVRLEPAAKGLISKYEPVAERCAVSAWRSLNRLPLVPEVAHIVVPTAAYWSEKYNQAVYHTAQKGYTVSAFLPLVPTERIAKVFGDNTAPAATVEK